MTIQTETIRYRCGDTELQGYVNHNPNAPAPVVSFHGAQHGLPNPAATENGKKYNLPLASFLLGGRESNP